jgi:hypothetical protein
MFFLETNHINYSNLNVKLTNICILEQEQFDLKRKITINSNGKIFCLVCRVQKRAHKKIDHRLMTHNTCYN